MTETAKVAFDADRWVRRNLDLDGYSAPNTDLRSIEINILLDGYVNVLSTTDPAFVGSRSISVEIAQAVTNWDKRYFIIRFGDTAMMRYNGTDRCKLHGYVENGCKC